MKKNKIKVKMVPFYDNKGKLIFAIPSNLTTADMVEMVPFYDNKGKLIFAIPSNLTMVDMVEMGLPIPRLVPRKFPVKDDEASHDPKIHKTL